MFGTIDRNNQNGCARGQDFGAERGSGRGRGGCAKHSRGGGGRGGRGGCGGRGQNFRQDFRGEARIAWRPATTSPEAARTTPPSMQSAPQTATQQGADRQAASAPLSGVCPLCKNHCPLSAPSCPKGAAYAANLAGGAEAAARG